MPRTRVLYLLWVQKSASNLETECDLKARVLPELFLFILAQLDAGLNQTFYSGSILFFLLIPAVEL